jgi:hypothetical protein
LAASDPVAGAPPIAIGVTAVAPVRAGPALEAAPTLADAAIMQ